MKAVKYQKKSLIKLEDLLRRRKSTLKKFILERGISTYKSLDEVCGRLGVKVPSLEAFEAALPSYVSSPTEGVVVVPPLDVISESSGERKELGDEFEAISPGTTYEEPSADLLTVESTEETQSSGVDAEFESKGYRKRMKKKEFEQ